MVTRFCLEMACPDRLVNNFAGFLANEFIHLYICLQADMEMQGTIFIIRSVLWQC